MAKINNQSVMQKLIDELKLYPGVDTIPTELAEKVLAVYQINSEQITVKPPTVNIVRHGRTNVAATVAMYTTPATGKFFLTNATICTCGKTANTSSEAKIDVVIGGTTYELITIQASLPTSSVSNAGQSQGLNFQNPILLDPGTVINVISSGASFTVNANIMGYTESA